MAISSPIFVADEYLAVILAELVTANAALVTANETLAAILAQGVQAAPMFAQTEPAQDAAPTVVELREPDPAPARRARRS